MAKSSTSSGTSDKPATDPASGAVAATDAPSTVLGAGNDPVIDGRTAAAAQELRGEPENAVRAAEAAAGSALDAPGVGAGPAGRAGQIEAVADRVGVAERLVGSTATGGVGDTVRVPGPAGVEPGLYDTLGAHGARPDLDGPDYLGARRPVLTLDRFRTLADGNKLSAALPSDREALQDLMDVGFDMVVTSRQDGRRRAGVVHPTAPTMRRAEDFTAAELAGLMADPMLFVQHLS